MKRIIFLIIIPVYSLLSQEGWHWQNPLPFGDAIQKVFFIDELNGWMAPFNPTLLRTTDGGDNWEIIYTDIIFNDIFFIDPLEGWAIGDSTVEGALYSIYHTTDGGETWEIQLADTTVRYDIYFVDRLHGWACGDGLGGTLLSTKNGGKTWKRQAEGLFGLGDDIFGITFLDSLKGWAVGGINWGLYTLDGGESWTRDSSLAGARKLIYTDSLHLWGISGSRSVYRSVNGGETWNKVQLSEVTDEIRARDIFAINNNDVYVATTYGVFASTDGGQTWILHSEQTMNSFFFLDSSEVWGGGIGLTEAGLFHSIDGGKTWENLITSDVPYGFEWYRAVDFVDANTGWIVGNTPKSGDGAFILKTIDGGESWSEQAHPSDSYFLNIFMLDKEYGWIVGREGAILHTKNGGQDWIIQNSAVDYTLWAVHFANRQTGWAVGGDFTGGSSVQGIILHTNNSGETWIDQTPGVIPRLFDVSFVDSLQGWVVGGGGSVYDYGIILHTEDGGKTWTTQRSGYGLDFRGVEFFNYKFGWVIGYDLQTNAPILHTSDGGKTWIGQYDAGGSDLKFIDEQTGWLVGSFGSIYHTNNGGETWIRQPSYTTNWFYGVDFVNSKMGWIIGDHGTIMNTTNGGNEEPPEPPKPPEIDNFILSQNYPNPFNQGTTIQIELAKNESFVNLNIFDILGKKIISLCKDKLDKGIHRFYWEGVNKLNMQVSSGIYLYQLEVDGLIQTKKMLRIK